MGWNYYTQQMEEMDSLGAILSKEIDCPVHHPAYNRNLYECKHGVIFPYYLVKGGDWNLIRRKHEEEQEYSDGAGSAWGSN